VAAKKRHDVASDSRTNADEQPVLRYKRERSKINSLARVLQLENALYNDQIVMRFADLSDQINIVDKHVEDLRLDMQEAIRREFMYLVQKMLQTNRHNNNSNNSLLIDYGV
jgi:hypothetical protein